MKPFICFTLGVLSGIATGALALFLFEQAVMDRDWFPRPADA